MIFGTAQRLSRLQGKQLNPTVDGLPINSKTTYKYLGVHLDSTLSFETHIDKTYKRAAGRVTLLRKLHSSNTWKLQKAFTGLWLCLFLPIVV